MKIEISKGFVAGDKSTVECSKKQEAFAVAKASWRYHSSMDR